MFLSTSLDRCNGSTFQKCQHHSKLCPCWSWIQEFEVWPLQTRKVANASGPLHQPTPWVHWREHETFLSSQICKQWENNLKVSWMWTCFKHKRSFDPRDSTEQTNTAVHRRLTDTGATDWNLERPWSATERETRHTLYLIQSSMSIQHLTNKEQKMVL